MDTPKWPGWGCTSQILTAALAQAVPEAVMAKVSEVGWWHEAGSRRGDIVVVFNAPNRVIHFGENEWLNDACIARICLECP